MNESKPNGSVLSKRRLIITLLTVALLAFRKFDSLRNPQLWAEDGGLFFVESEMWGGWRILFLPYEGYLHLLPRFLAASSASLPLEWVPGYFVWSALFVVGAVAWWIQSPRIKFPGAWVAALAIAVIPHNGEVYLTICNLQWITALALFSLLIADDATSGMACTGDLIVLVLVGLTGPFIVLALPMFIWRAWRRRSRWSYLLLGLAAICVLAHIPHLVNRPAPNISQPFAPVHYAAVAGSRVIATMFVGNWQLNEGVYISLVLAVGSLLVVGVWRRHLWTAGGGILLTMLAASLLATAYKARIDTWGLTDLVSADRYFFIAKVLLVWFVAAFAVTSRGWMRSILIVILFLPVIANGRRFIYPQSPDYRWRDYCPPIERGEPTRVPILPAGFSFLHPGRHNH